ncbi:hypothetical protein GB937_003466 [Aspergillus fischeri]|nr:hypothetical protein GB937_003466 [Aspergillus fischeri]
MKTDHANPITTTAFHRLPLIAAAPEHPNIAICGTGLLPKVAYRPVYFVAAVSQGRVGVLCGVPVLVDRDAAGFGVGEFREAGEV